MGAKVILLAVLVGCACGKHAAAPDAAAAADGGLKEQQAALNESFRKFFAATYPVKKTADRACVLQAAVIRRHGPPAVWLGVLAGTISRGTEHIRVRLIFSQQPDGGWRCDDAESSFVDPPVTDGGPADTACALVGNTCRSAPLK